ncbi:MAG: DUF134 domain-containing protein [Clostridia bacterium]|nr:DUF134 domain-containing protein [Clostridia bacterium]
MARPKKERVICSTPRHRHFAPIHEEPRETVTLEADEYEVLRLHDLEHLSQAEVANQMLVSRPTVAMLLLSAHEKIADALVNGKPVRIAIESCSVCEIGSSCPPEKKNSCTKKHRCAASCRRECEGCSTN